MARRRAGLDPAFFNRFPALRRNYYDRPFSNPPVRPDPWQARYADQRFVPTVRPDPWQRQFEPPPRFIDRAVTGPSTTHLPPNRPPLEPEEGIVGPGPAGWFGPGGMLPGPGVRVLPNLPIGRRPALPLEGAVPIPSQPLDYEALARILGGIPGRIGGPDTHVQY